MSSRKRASKPSTLTAQWAALKAKSGPQDPPKLDVSILERKEVKAAATAPPAVGATASARAAKPAAGSSGSSSEKVHTSRTHSAVKRASAASAKPAKKRRPEFQPAIHRVVNYKPEGVQELTEAQQKVYSFVCKHFIIPRDIETTRYGPLSGTCYEERVIGAFCAGQLKPRSGSEAQSATKACVGCGALGHWARYCPEALK